MKFTNIHGIEPIFQRALEKDVYSKGESDFSITELLQPARANALIRAQGENHTVDVSTRVAGAIGTGWHLFIERGARPDIDIVEKRFFAKFGEFIVSAQIDLFEGDAYRLVDWKTAKAYPFTDKGGKGQKDEWLRQLNGQAEIMRRNGYEIKSLHIAGVIKDFDLNCLDISSRKYMKGYPKAGIVTVDIPMMSSYDISKWIETRIASHLEARVKLSSCGSSETWGGNRCKSYCDASEYCDQYKQAQKTGLMEEK